MATIIKNIQKWILLLTIFLFPFFFLTTTVEFFSTNKFYLLTFISLLVLLLSAIELIIRKKIILTKTPFGRILTIILITYGLSILFSSFNKLQAFYIIPNGFSPILVLVLFYYLVISRFNSKKGVERILNVFSYGALIPAFIVVLSFFNVFKDIAIPGEFQFLKNPFFSTIGNQTDTIVFFGFLLLTEIVKLYTNLKKSSSVLKNVVFGIIFFVAVSFSIYGYLNPKAINPDIETATNNLPPFSVSWYAAVESLKDIRTALVGFGVDNFAGVFSQVKPVTYNQTDLWQLNFNLSRSHLLNVWTETGLLGLSAWLLLILYVIREIHGLFTKKDKSWMWFMLSGLYLLISYIVLPTSFLILFLSIIYLIALTLYSNNHDEKKSQTFDLSQIPLVYFGMSIIVLIFVSGAGYAAGRLYAGEYYYKKSFDIAMLNDGKGVYDSLTQSLKMNPTREIVINRFSQVNLLLANNVAQKEELTDDDRQSISIFIQQAIGSAKRLIVLNPSKPYHWTNLAVIYRNIIRVAEGSEAWTVAAYRRAMQLDPVNPQLVLNLGGVYYAIGDYPSSLIAFQRAVTLKPDWANARYNLAWAYFKNNQPEEATAALQTILPLIQKGTKDYDLVQENIEEFKKEIPDVKEATQEGQLQLPETPEPVLSPPLELDEDLGPEKELESQPELQEPTPTPSIPLSPSPSR